MSRIVSIEQSAPGVWVVNVQRSRSESIGKILESIARPPLEEEESGSPSTGALNGTPNGVQNGAGRPEEDVIRNSVAGSPLVEKRRPRRER